MSLQFDGSGKVTIPSGGFTLRPSLPWTWVIEEVEFTSNSQMVAGNTVESGPYVGWFNNKFEFRFGPNTGVSGPFTPGQLYRVEMSCDGAGNTSMTVVGVGTSTGVQNADSTIDLFGQYSNGLNFTGLIGKKWIITGAIEGDFTYNFEQPEGSSVLVEELQGADGNLSSFTTGGFGVPQASDDPPTITILGNNPETILVGDTYTDAGATASDVEDGDLTGSIVTTNNVDNNAAGDYTVDYEVTDSGGNTSTASRVVNVVAVDTTAPVITLLGNNPLELVEGTSYVEPGFTASDDTDGDVTSNVVVGGDTVNENVVGTYSITYDVSDAAGNPAVTQTRTVNVVTEQSPDTTAPVITLQGNNPLTLTEGTPYVEPGFTATDDIDGDITANVVVTGSIDENTVGTQTLDYDVSDAAGNPAITQTRTVEVVAAPAETITITSISEGETRKRDINGQATFTIAGTIDGGNGPVEYRLDNGAWQVLDAGTGTTFTGDVVVTNQQDVEVRLSSNTNATDIVRYVTAAMIIVEGPSQSNGAGRGDNLQTPVFDPNQPRPTMWKNGIGFSLLEDPTSNESTPIIKGSMWPHIAKKYADLGIPVCVGNVAVGGTTVGGAWSTIGQNYQKIDLFAAACGGLSLITTCIGESDTAFGTTKEEYKTRYLEAANKLNADYGAEVYATYFPVGSTLASNSNLQNIRDAISELIAENAFINFGGDLAQIDISGQPDGLHIIYDDDMEQAAQIRFNAFQGIASTLTVEFNGAPDGVYDFIYWDATSIDLNAPLGVEQVTVSNGQFTINSTLQPGSEVVGFIPGATPPSTGGAIYGVTV